jgi:hypothetical protein
MENIRTVGAIAGHTISADDLEDGEGAANNENDYV